MSQDEPRKKHQVVIHTPTNRLAALVNRPGGMERETAIAHATKRVEALRQPTLEILDGLIGELEIANALDTMSLEQRLHAILQLGDRIITLAGTFELTFLTEATKRLCDLMPVLSARHMSGRDQVAVFISAIRLFGPKGETVPEAAAKDVLAELRRVLEHFGVMIVDDSAPHDLPPEPEMAAAQTRH